MLKKIGVSLLLFLLVLLVVSIIFFQDNKPQYKGSIELKGVQEVVNVYFDDYGVPHIFAQNQQDAYQAFGYVHAQDRLWQMELVRRIAAGRLSEIFGEELVETDRMFKGMGITEAAQKSIAKIDTTSDSYRLTRAYLDGVNQFMNEGKTPLEFRLLGIEKKPYTVEDIYHVLGYMAFGFAQAYRTDPLLTALKDKLGTAYIEDLDIDIDPRTTVIKNFRRNSMWPKKITAALTEALDFSPVPPFIGSNSWVVGPKKTESGKVILANDPHIAFAQPAVWYQAHIVTPDYEMYGFHLGLNPFPFLGHNHDYAYGVTMLENDDFDFYYEDSTQTFQVRKDTIFVKGEDPIPVEFRIGSEGPVVNDLFKGIDSEEPVSMHWVYTQRENHLLAAAYELSHSRNIYDFREAAVKIHAPGLNVMYGDAKGNIAWFGAAHLYNKGEGIQTKFILDKEIEGVNETNFLDFKMNPQAINPRWGYVYSANNQPEAVEDNYYPGYYLPEDRAKRIVELLSSKEKFTADDMEEMITDVQSSVSPSLVKILLDNVSMVKLSPLEKQAVDELKNWDGSYESDLLAPTIYFKLIYHFLHHTFADEMGEDLFDDFLKTHLYKRQITKQLKWNRSPWWDDIRTKEVKELKDEIITRAFHQAIKELESQLGDDIEDWQWSRVLQVTHKHAFDKSPMMRGFFNVGPFVTDGGNEVINNQLFRLNNTGEYEVYGGPSTRRIIDFSDIENARAILPTGQSGNVFSKHYDDQAQKYLDGEFVKMMLNKEEIKASKNMLVILPD